MICSNACGFDLSRKILQRGFRSEKAIVKRYLRNDRRTLDFGCGTGGFCVLFEPAKYLGIDTDKSCIDYANRKYTDYEFKVFQDTIPSKEGEFENVLICEVLHHIDDCQMDKVLAEVRRVCAGKAKVLILDQVPAICQRKLTGRFLFKHDRGKSARSPEKMRRFLRRYFEVKGFNIICSGPYTLQAWELET